MNTRPVEEELFHTDGQTYCHEEANSRISQFCEKAPTNSCMANTKLERKGKLGPVYTFQEILCYQLIHTFCFFASYVYCTTATGCQPNCS